MHVKVNNVQRSLKTHSQQGDVYLQCMVHFLWLTHSPSLNLISPQCMKHLWLWVHLPEQDASLFCPNIEQMIIQMPYGIK